MTRSIATNLLIKLFETLNIPNQAKWNAYRIVQEYTKQQTSFEVPKCLETFWILWRLERPLDGDEILQVINYRSVTTLQSSSFGFCSFCIRYKLYCLLSNILQTEIFIVGKGEGGGNAWGLCSINHLPSKRIQVRKLKQINKQTNKQTEKATLTGAKI